MRKLYQAIFNMTQYRTSVGGDDRITILFQNGYEEQIDSVVLTYDELLELQDLLAGPKGRIPGWKD